MGEDIVEGSGWTEDANKWLKSGRRQGGVTVVIPEE